MTQDKHNSQPKLDAVCRYLCDIEWYGVERIPSLFPMFCGTTDDEYHQHAGMVLMLSGASRILAPQHRIDQFLVLEGNPGVGKSWFLQTLFGRDYFCTDQQNGSIRDKWCIEVSETYGLSKGDARSFVERLNTLHTTGQSVYVMTNNVADSMEEPSSGLRFLPVRIERVDLGSLAAVRDQLWAESVTRLEQMGVWKPEPYVFSPGPETTP